MLKSVIEEIYLDNKGLSEKISPSEDYKKVSDKAYELYKKLLNSLDGEQKENFVDFADTEVDACAEAELTHFKAGFKTGFILALECLI